ncbi:zincin [Jaminaea rosea]|uniref:mitochondrial intermediate peptidase n=1 Tax=Jaminaea rosea TaxID=1569628 RepID=A0A316UM68_9BASI|nr:zincin [Jaminaea rosea]PWN26357.1 zincin [Jaminaea rosea]
MSATLGRIPKGLARIPSRRLISSASSPRLARPAPSPRPTLFASSERDKDAQDLCSLFDSLSSKKSAGSSSLKASSSSSPPSGLFGSPSLPTPSSFAPVAQQALIRAQLLVHRIVTAPQKGEGEMRAVVKNLDRLSDVLCGVIDLAELVRNAHPDEAWRDAANEAYEGLCGFMNILNTHTGLYEVLKRVLDDEMLRNSLSEEALAVAQGFLRDFEKSGIHLPDKQREQFVDLSDEILVLGRAFMQGATSGEEAPPIARFKRSWFSDTHSNLLAALSSSPALIPSTSSEVHLDPAHATWEFPTILRYSQSEEARKAAFVAMNTSAKGSVDVLEQLLDKRRKLAGLTGYESFAQMSLGDKMAKNPSSVAHFLDALQTHHHPLAARKLSELQALKPRDEAPLEAWDRDYYAERYLRTLSTSMPGSTTPISPFLSVGNVFSGLSRMLSAIYGIRLRAANLEAGEAWDGDVVKLQVVEEDASSATGETVIGTIYADLFSRSGKPPSAAHYTVRCSRRIDDDDEDGDFRFGRLQDGAQVDPSQLGSRGTSPLKVEGRATPGRTGLYQLPIVVLLCDFVRGTAGPSLLSWSEVETLFHEMGHAIHSMIGRTEFHNVSGTRCATDLVELPSILMEHFVSSPSVVSLVARHHSTGLELPYDALRRHLATSVQALDDLDTHNQILLAILDQRYHGSDFSGDSTEEMARLYSTRGLFDAATTQSGQHAFLRQQTWHSQFSHLFGYGATYYSYLLDRVLASRVWAQLFAADPLSRDAGEKYKGGLLKWGGGKEGWGMLSELLGEDLSMERVGEWGIKRGEERKAR